MEHIRSFYDDNRRYGDSVIQNESVNKERTFPLTIFATTKHYIKYYNEQNNTINNANTVFF